MLDLGTSFIASVARDPNALAIVDGDVRLTYAEWYRRISSVVAGLGMLGLKPGDRVIVNVGIGESVRSFGGRRGGGGCARIYRRFEWKGSRWPRSTIFAHDVWLDCGRSGTIKTSLARVHATYQRRSRSRVRLSPSD